MDQKLSNKERMEMFQSGVSQLTAENEVSNVRELLRQRYIKNKAEEDAKLKKEEEEREAKRVEQEKKANKELDTSYMGRQLARVFRFGKTSNVRQRLTAQNRANRRPQIDPFDDPNVLLENFGFHNDEQEHDRLPLLAQEESDDEEIDDDSVRSLVRHFWQPLTWGQLAWTMLKISLYIGGQVWAYKYGFGAAFFAFALLVYICTNLRRKAPGELSAYSVFNPFCQHIPSTAGREQPQDNIVLGFGQL